MELVSLFIGLTFVNNVVLSKFYAICPLLGVSKKPKNALNMGYAVTFGFDYIYLGYCIFSTIC